MKAQKFLKRDRTTTGRATSSSVVCQLTFPANDENYELRPINTNRIKALKTMRKFVDKHLQKRTLLLDEASFTIYAEVRASSGSLRRKRLARWTFGDDLDLVFKKASQVWENLEPEEDYVSVEIPF